MSLCHKCSERTTRKDNDGQFTCQDCADIASYIKERKKLSFLSPVSGDDYEDDYNKYPGERSYIPSWRRKTTK